MRCIEACRLGCRHEEGRCGLVPGKSAEQNQVLAAWVYRPRDHAPAQVLSATPSDNQTSQRIFHLPSNYLPLDLPARHPVRVVHRFVPPACIQLQQDRVKVSKVQAQARAQLGLLRRQRNFRTLCTIRSRSSLCSVDPVPIAKPPVHRFRAGPPAATARRAPPDRVGPARPLSSSAGDAFINPILLRFPQVCRSCAPGRPPLCPPLPACCDRPRRALNARCAPAPAPAAAAFDSLNPALVPGRRQ